jgi:hypothetical protein
VQNQDWNAMGSPSSTIRLLVMLICLSCQAKPEAIAGPVTSPSSDSSALTHQELSRLLHSLHVKYGERIKHWDRIIIVDFRKPIDGRRLYLLDGKSATVLLRTTVAHGVNSGTDYATSMSNEPGTLKSSPGAYLTQGTYFGTFGYSLRLKGLDSGINSNAEMRNIILHSSKLMRTKYSWGCFAVPDEHHQKIIDLMKGGRLLFVIPSDAH